MNEVYGFSDRGTAEGLRRLYEEQKREIRKLQEVVDRAEIRDLTPIVFANNTGGTIPPFACIATNQCVMAEHANNKFQIIHMAEKPGSEPPCTILMNGPAAVPNRGVGYAQRDEFLRAMYSSQITDFGRPVGPVAGQWHLGIQSYLPAFRFIADIGGGEMQVQKIYDRPDIMFQAPSGGLPAGSSGGPSVTDCKLIDDWNDSYTVTNTTVKIRNWAQQVVVDERDRYGKAQLNASCRWCVNSEDCVQGEDDQVPGGDPGPGGVDQPIDPSTGGP